MYCKRSHTPKRGHGSLCICTVTFDQPPVPSGGKLHPLEPEGPAMLKAYTRAVARINSIRSDEEGATAVEYGLMVALIAVVIIGAVALIGTNLSTMFQGVADEL